MPNKPGTAEKILNRTKGLRAQMQEGEEPQLALPGIWDNGQSKTSTACDVIVTNQRILGYYYKSFPREHLFVDALNLADLKQVTWREKSHEPIFREILVSDGQRQVYIRTPRQKCEELYATLKEGTQHTITSAPATSYEQQVREEGTTPSTDTEQTPLSSTVPQSQQQATIYGREEIKRPFEYSSLAVVLLLVGGIFLELIGIIAWSATNQSSVGVPLIIAGLLAFIVSIVVRKQSR